MCLIRNEKNKWVYKPKEERKILYKYEERKKCKKDKKKDCIKKEKR